jgi:hypothetical protein
LRAGSKVVKVAEVSKEGKPMEQGETVSITLDVPRELHRRAKGLAGYAGVKLKDLLIEAIEASIQRKEEATK